MVSKQNEPLVLYDAILRTQAYWEGVVENLRPVNFADIERTTTTGLEFD
jgi:hypothetical protein